MKQILKSRMGAGLIIASLMAVGCSDSETTKTSQADKPKRVVPTKVEKAIEPKPDVQPAAFVEVTAPIDEFEGVDVIEAGREAFQSRDYETASRALQVAADEGNAKPYDMYLLGLSLWKSGELDRSEQVLVDASWKMEKFIKAPVNLARVRLEKGDFNGAHEAIERALAIDPVDPNALNVSGRVHMAQGNVDAAAESFARANEFGSNDPWPLNNLGYLLLISGRADEAVGPLEQAVLLDETMATAWHNLALAREQIGDRIGAAEAAVKASQLDEQPTLMATAERLSALVPQTDSDTTAVVQVDETLDGSQTVVDGSSEPTDETTVVETKTSDQDKPSLPLP